MYSRCFDTFLCCLGNYSLNYDFLNNLYKREILTVIFKYLHYFLELQKKAAALLGKEDALFVSSGTMGNIIAGKN